MTNPVDPLQPPTFYAVLACWWAFATVFLLRKRPPAAPQRVRNSKATSGIFIVALGYAMVWSFRRPSHGALLPLGPLAAATLDVAATAIAVASVWLVAAAVRTLGKQWNVRAALVEEHALITHGPYALVRHPIYLGMLGMLVATGLTLSHWAALLAGIVLGVVGTIVRVRAEEELLRTAFGEAFEEYRTRVPAFLPGIY